MKTKHNPPYSGNETTRLKQTELMCLSDRYFTFPFQRSPRKPCLSPKTFFTTETNYEDLRSGDKIKIPKARGLKDISITT